MMNRGPVAWTLLGVLPTLLTLAFAVGAVHHQPAFDFHALWQAGRDVAHGHDPYPRVAAISSAPNVAHDEFVYPAPVAVAMVPLGLLPFGVAAGLFVAALVLSVAVTLRLLGVSDWRCYGVAYASIPVLESFRLGAVTPFLALGLAAAWRLRDRRWTLAACVAALVVAKLFLWPLVVWLAVTRRGAAAVRAVALSVACVCVGWAVVGFGTLVSYPEVLRKMTDVQFRKSYAVGALAGTPSASTAVAVLGIVAIVVAARRERAFEMSILVALAASPLVWLHYDALLLVPVALASRRLSIVWLLPLLLWLTPHPESGGSAWRIAITLAVGLAAVAWPRNGSLIRWRPLRGVAQPG